MDPTDFALALGHQLNNNSALFKFEEGKENGLVGITLEEIDSVVGMDGTKNDANMPNSPESTNFTLAEHIKREYALRKVFSSDVAKAHRMGDIHLHKLGMIDRPYCSGQSLEYIKKFGIGRFSSLASVKPASHVDALLDHMLRFSMALRARFSGAIGWDAVNIFLAPYLVGMSDAQIRQYAQKLIYQFNQTTAPIGAQPIFSDINIYWEIPKHFEDVPAIGPRGEYTGKTYKDYEKEAQAFVWQLFNVYKDGDVKGLPFFWPKADLHITERFWETSHHGKFLEHACQVASKFGNPYFIFDRGETVKVSECCRVSFELSDDDLSDTKHPWRMRYNAAPYITPNLPRVAYKARGSNEKFFEILERILELIVKAHLQKKRYIKKLLSLKEKGPLGMLTVVQQEENQAYLRLDKTSYLISPLGVNDAVFYHTGKAMHESDKALKFGLKIVAFMKKKCDEFTKRYSSKFILEQDPAESTCYRLARLDLRYFPGEAARTVHGDLKKGEVYYTNSTHLVIDARIDPIDRIRLEGLFNPLIEGGCLTHVWLGESKPSASSIANLVKKTFFETANTQIAFSPEFTVCRNCGKVSRGLKKTCSFCKSRKVDGITRVTGFYTFTSGWNKGKIGELKDRYRVRRMGNA
jgi:anaerobic ribonucleoside-triphosphate reductase